MYRMILNETSYFGAGCREAIATEAGRRGFKKAFFVTDKEEKFRVNGEEKERVEVYETGIYWNGNHYDVRRDWILRERNGESADRCIAEK